MSRRPTRIAGCFASFLFSFLVQCPHPRPFPSLPTAASQQQQQQQPWLSSSPDRWARQDGARASQRTAQRAERPRRRREECGSRTEEPQRSWTSAHVPKMRCCVWCVRVCRWRPPPSSSLAAVRMQSSGAAPAAAAPARSRSARAAAHRPRCSACRCVCAGLTKALVSQFSTFVRSKPHLNIGTIGHVDHGTTSTARRATRCDSPGPRMCMVGRRGRGRAASLMHCARLCPCARILSLCRKDDADRRHHQVHGRSGSGQLPRIRRDR